MKGNLINNLQMIIIENHLIIDYDNCDKIPEISMEPYLSYPKNYSSK
jgi:hypothetical protein